MCDAYNARAAQGLLREERRRKSACRLSKINTIVTQQVALQQGGHALPPLDESERALTVLVAVLMGRVSLDEQKGGDMTVDLPGQHVLERMSVLIDDLARRAQCSA